MSKRTAKPIEVTLNINHGLKGSLVTNMKKSIPIQATKECCDSENPDFVIDVDDGATIKGVPRQVRARLLQYASLLHTVDFKADEPIACRGWIHYMRNGTQEDHKLMKRLIKQT